MNKLFIRLAVIFAVLLLAACSSDDEDMTTTVSTNETGEGEEVPPDAVRLTISINDGEQFLNEQQVAIEEGANLLEVMEETFFIETDDNEEITSIERVQASEEDGTSWHLFIDGELRETKAKDYTVTGGEKIVFDLQ